VRINYRLYFSFLASHFIHMWSKLRRQLKHFMTLIWWCIKLSKQCYTDNILLHFNFLKQSFISLLFPSQYICITLWYAQLFISDELFTCMASLIILSPDGDAHLVRNNECLVIPSVCVQHNCEQIEFIICTQPYSSIHTLWWSLIKMHSCSVSISAGSTKFFDDFVSYYNYTQFPSYIILALRIHKNSEQRKMYLFSTTFVVCTVCLERHCALRLWYVDLVVSIEVAIEVCCCFTVFSC
jgi:hypothetical protein